MLKRTLCEARFVWEFSCQGPLLIRDGRYRPKGKKEGGFPDCLFISHLHGKELDQVAEKCNNSPPNLPFYVPGTSIRGPFRSQCERVVRSLLPAETAPPLTACSPFGQEEANPLGCSNRLSRLRDETAPYKAACPACKLFGCAGLASRISLPDAGIRPGHSSVYRDMIGIDRFTGGVFKGTGEGGGANMRFHVLENTAFSTRVSLTNFELWQLGLLAYVFRDFAEGLVPIGSGKTKGFGRVRAEVTEITLTYPRPTKNIEHLGSLLDSEPERDRYGLHKYTAPSFEYMKAANGGLSLYHNFSVTDIERFWATVAPAFNDYMSNLLTGAKEVKT